MERLKLDTISSNIANVNTNQTQTTAAYQKKSILFSENLKNSREGTPATYGVKVTGIAADETEKLTYDPTNPLPTMRDMSVNQMWILPMKWWQCCKRFERTKPMFLHPK